MRSSWYSAYPGLFYYLVQEGTFVPVDVTSSANSGVHAIAGPLPSRHATEASSLWVQVPMLAKPSLSQSKSLSSAPVHAILLNAMGPVPRPNLAPGKAVAPVHRKRHFSRRWSRQREKSYSLRQIYSLTQAHGLLNTSVISAKRNHLMN